MEQVELVSLFLLGLIGTGHCLGMCGPLVLALPVRSGKISGHVFYHLGRICTYLLTGSLLGTVGSGLKEAASSQSFQAPTGFLWAQMVLSLLASSVMLGFGLIRLGVVAEPAWMSGATPAKLPGFARIQKKVWVERRERAIFWFGVLLGFLPCGLSWGVFAKSLATGSVFWGAMAALAFGLGTLPGLLLLGGGLGSWMQRYRAWSDLVSGLMMVGMSISTAMQAIRPWLQ